jgi:hypothetical protein
MISKRASEESSHRDRSGSAFIETSWFLVRDFQGSALSSGLLGCGGAHEFRHISSVERGRDSRQTTRSGRFRSAQIGLRRRRPSRRC